MTQTGSPSRGSSDPPLASVPGGTGHPRKWWILVTVSFGMFMALLDVTIVNIAIPTIMDDLDASVKEVSWVISAYSLALAVLFLSMGRVSDKFGQKRVFAAVGIVGFTLFSLLCGLAPTIEWLVAFRVGQGVAGAALTPISLAILLGSFPGHQRGLAVGLWGAVGSIAGAIGPTLGGIIIEYLSWHWIFFVNIPVGIGALLMTLAFIPERRLAREGGGVDIPGILISAAGLFCLVLALIQGNDWGWTSSRVLVLFAVAFACYPVFLWWESRSISPMFDLRLLRIRSFTAANTAMFFIGVALGGAMFLLVLFLVTVLGYSELEAALAITPMPLTALIISPFVGRLVDRIGPRVPGVAGCLCFFAGLVLLAQLDGGSSAADAAWRTILLGAGIGFSMPTFSAAAMGSLPPYVAGVGSGALNTLRQVGFSLGLALVVAIFSYTVSANMKSGADEAVTYVRNQTSLPGPVRDELSAEIRRGAQEAADAGGTGRLINSAPPGSAETPSDSGTPSGAPVSTDRALRATVADIFREAVARSFAWPFYVAAIAALLAVVPALLTGRRLGEHEGHHEMTRAERATDKP